MSYHKEIGSVINEKYRHDFKYFIDTYGTNMRQVWF